MNRVIILDNITFSSAKELYIRLLPALKSKTKLLKRNGFCYIKEQDIWNALRNKKWQNTYGLELCDMVDDILNTDSFFFNNYYHEKSQNINIVTDLPKLRREKY